MTPDVIYRRHGQPDLQPIKRRDGQPLGSGVPSHAVTPMWLGHGKKKAPLSDTKIVITDFGEAYVPAETLRTHSNTPASYAPPEARFTDSPLSFSADIWSLACTVWEVLSFKPLFEPWGATDDDILADQVDLLGKLPEEWWARWDSRRDYFTEDGELDIDARHRRYGDVRHTWDDCLERCIRRPRREDGMEEMSEREEEALLGMMRSMLVFRPEARVSVAEVMGSAWMKEWALPDLELVKAHWSEA